MKKDSTTIKKDKLNASDVQLVDIPIKEVLLQTINAQNVQRVCFQLKQVLPNPYNAVNAMPVDFLQKPVVTQAANAKDNAPPVNFHLKLVKHRVPLVEIV